VAPRGDLDGFWRLALPIASALTRALLRLRVRGEEHVPALGCALLAGNHISSLDGIVLAVETARRTRRRIRFLVAAEFFGGPVYGPILRATEQIPVHRGARDLAALADARGALASGTLAGIYPEGGVAEFPEQGVRRGKSGAARLALSTGCPVIPVGIWGSQVRWPYPGFSFRRIWRRPTVALSYGPPIPAEGRADDAHDLNRFTDRLMAAITDETNHARTMTEEVR
jgi:1-acyl-sn-glycerol-3-phosphate acyltransferase